MTTITQPQRQPTLDHYIKKVWAHECSGSKKKLGKDAREWIHGALVGLLQRLTHGGITMMICARRKTISEDDIRAVVSMIMVGHLGEETVRFIDDTSHVYSTSLKKKKKSVSSSSRISMAERSHLLFAPSRIRKMFIKDIQSRFHIHDVRLPPLTILAITSVLEFVLRHLLKLVCQSNSDTNNTTITTIHTQNIIDLLTPHESLTKSLCFLGL